MPSKSPVTQPLRSVRKALAALMLISLVAVIPNREARAQNPPNSYKELKYPQLNPIKVPEPTRFELPNGMTVYLLEDHEVPMISASAIVRVGSRWEPVSKAGLATITGTVMRTGGTNSRSGNQLDDELDRLGAVIETGIGDDSGTASLSLLKEDADKGLAILADLLQNPAFPEDKIELSKIEQRENIARRNDDPGGVAEREFSRILYGKESPYGHQTEYDTLNAIKQADLIAFHQQYFQPENVILGAWGDFQMADMRARIERAFAGWKRGGHPRPQPPEWDYKSAASRAGLYFVAKDDVNQSIVYIGEIGGRRNDPDYYALQVMNTILGGGFSSRLVNNVRSNLGLAYTVYSAWGAAWDRPGLFVASGGTKSGTTVKMTNAIKQEINRIRETEPSNDDLVRAKDAILKGFAFEFDSTGKILQRLMAYDYYGYPRDYLQRYRDNIEKVGRGDVLRVAREHIKPENFIVLVLGKQADFDQPLSTLGQVHPVDITIPGPKREPIAPATQESSSQGKRLLLHARTALGGQAVQGVKDFTRIGEMSLDSPQGPMSIKSVTIIKLPGKALSRLMTPVGEVVQGFDGQTAWVKTPQGVQEAPGSYRDELANTALRETIALLQNANASGVTVQSLGKADVEGHAAEVVAIQDAVRNLEIKLFLDAATGLPLKKSYAAELMGSPGQVDEVYGDYREIGGVKVPFRMTLFSDGKKVGDLKITDVKINTNVEDSAFKKP
jgi:zinc protease